MIHYFIIGLLLGWGAAIPIGPINLEIVRRNINGNFRVGLFFGYGACSVDLCYLVLASLGAMMFLNQPLILALVGFAGAAVLIWFSSMALRSAFKPIQDKTSSKPVNPSIITNYAHGYLMTLLNPMTIVFWASVSSQVALMAKGQSHVFISLGLGVIIATMLWATLVNIVAHLTRHRFSDRATFYLDLLGGILLLGFAIFGIVHGIMLLTR